LARSEEEAVLAAHSIDFPVVLKLHSETITHKSDVGGVKLDLHGDSAVRDAFRSIQSAAREKAGEGAFLGVTVQPRIKLDGYELILGSSIDPQFGPVILFGSGGELVEVYHDRALALPPLNSTLAIRLMEQTRIYRALQGVRGRSPVDMKALENTLVHFSRLVVEQPWIKEIDINPLLASPEKIIALDARVLLQPAGVAEEQLPRPAIRPYPAQYRSTCTMKDGTPVTLRPIRPEDEPAIAKFHETLSDRTVYLRYFHMEQLSTRVAHERLTRICFIDYAREMALVAVWNNPATAQPEIIAVGRLSRIHRTADAEVAVLVTDRFQNQGVGSALLSRLLAIARDEKLGHIEMSILMENMGMRALASRHEFKLQKTGDMSVVKAVLSLDFPPPTAS
jgi:acetyltransferase